MAVAEIPATGLDAPAGVNERPQSDAALQGAGSHGLAALAGLAGIGAAVSDVVERVRPSVVEIRTRGAGAGAGTIWRPQGTIVTNHHVVPHDRARVALADGRTFDAAVVARDPFNDLAVLQVEADDLPAAAIGDARTLRVGELVLAVGHPFGVRGALTVGVVNQVLPRRRPDWDPAGGSGGAWGSWRSWRELVLADVLLGPGNSGGPLTDASGRVVGINAMVHGGLALAVPAHVAEALVAGRGRPARPVLGVEVRDVTLPPALAALAPRTAGAGVGADGRPLGRAARAPDQPPGAVVVLGVEPGGPADRAGVLLGDVLVALDHEVVDGAAALLEALEWRRRRAGGSLRLRLLRGGAPREVLVEVDEGGEGGEGGGVDREARNAA
jgi:S1-C subfamily serine protease